MKLVLAAVLSLAACATVGPRPVNPDGSPAPYPSEMAYGAQICQQQCQELVPPREYVRYQTDGKCVCERDPRVMMPHEQRRPKNGT